MNSTVLAFSEDTSQPIISSEAPSSFTRPFRKDCCDTDKSNDLEVIDAGANVAIQFEHEIESRLFHTDKNTLLG